jgi:hypothetical protein
MFLNRDLTGLSFKPKTQWFLYNINYMAFGGLIAMQKWSSSCVGRIDHRRKYILAFSDDQCFVLTSFCAMRGFLYTMQVAVISPGVSVRFRSKSWEDPSMKEMECFVLKN